MILTGFLLLAGASLARADLVGDVRKALSTGPVAKAANGVQIVKLGQLREQDQILVSIRGDDKFIPASNLKVITTAAALEYLGPDFRFRTRLAMSEKGDLALVGDGDPTLGDSDYLAGTGWKVTTVFENWAAELKRAGVTSVNDVLADDSIFEELMMQPNWPLDQAHKDYVPQVAGINFSANCLDVYAIRNENGTASYRIDPPTKYVTVQNQLTVGGSHSLYLSRVLGGNKIVLKGTIDNTNRVPFRVTIHDPAMFAATVLKETLERAGIEVKGGVKRDRSVRAKLDASEPTPAWKVFAMHETALQPILEKTNKESINLYAESIGKRIAAKATGQPGSWKLLADTQATFMKTVGAPTGDYVFDDGCGLSKVNAVAPAAFCATLAHVFHGDNREKYIATMSVGGVDGTLRNRYKTDGLAGRVFAKSGSVNRVSTLSGYLKTAGGEWYAFSILMNEIADRGAAQRAQDEIVKAIDNAAQ